MKQLPAWMVAVRSALTGVLVGCAADAAGGVAGPDDGGRVTIRVQSEGGQTGAEGGCVGVGREVTGFTADDVRALVEGTHHATLGYIQAIPPLPRLDASAEPQGEMHVSVRVLEDAAVESECGGGLAQRVEVTLAFDEPALDVIFEQMLFAFSAELAQVQVELGAEVLEATQLPALTGVRASTLTLAFTPQGLRGHMNVSGTCGGMLVVPNDARCEEPSRPELDLEQPVYGVRPSDVLQTALQALSAQGPLPLQWDDGTSSALSFEILEQPSFACSRSAMWVENKSEAMHDAPLRVRLRTEDGRLDLTTPARLVWTVFPEKGIGGRSGWDGSWILSGWNVLPPALLRENGSLSDFELPDERAVYVRFGVHNKDADQPVAWNLDIGTSAFSSEVVGAAGDAAPLPDSANVACFGSDLQPVASARKPGATP